MAAACLPLTQPFSLSAPHSWQGREQHSNITPSPFTTTPCIGTSTNPSVRSIRAEGGALQEASPRLVTPFVTAVFPPYPGDCRPMRRSPGLLFPLVSILSVAEGHHLPYLFQPLYSPVISRSDLPFFPYTYPFSGWCTSS